MTPDLSILILAYKSQTDLELCLPSIKAQTFTDYEIIVINNSPEDHLDTWLSAHYPEVVCVNNPENTGYAGGNNLGLAYVQGQHLLILNPDTKLEPGALTTLMAAVTQNPNALINPKLLKPDGLLNGCGLEMHFSGVTTCRGLDLPANSFQALHEVPLVSGAAILVRTEVMVHLGGFDESYFMYMEDVELSLRAKLLGYRLLCEPEAVITHAYVQSMNADKYFYLERNRLLTLWKIYEGPTLRSLAPSLILTELLMMVYALSQGPQYVLKRYTIYTWFWQHWSDVQGQRRILQLQRKVSDEAILKDCLTSLPFDQLMKSQRFAALLNRLFEPLYKLGRPRLRRRTL